MIKIPPTILPLPLFINIDWFVINNACDSFCAGTIHFLHFIQFDLLELQPFRFQRSSYHLFNTSSFLCEYRINNCIEFTTDQQFLVLFLPTGFYISKVSLVIFDYFHKTTNQLWTQNLKMTGLKDYKSCPENVSLSLAKGKLDEKKWMEVFLSVRWSHVYFHIYHKLQKKLPFFRCLISVS